MSRFIGSPSHSPKQARYRRFAVQDIKIYFQAEKPSQALTGAIQQGLQNAVTDNFPGHSTKQNPAKPSKTQQKRQDRILFTALVHDQALIQVISAQSVTRLIRVRFSRLCVHRLTPCPAEGFCIRRDSVTASIIGLQNFP